MDTHIIRVQHLENAAHVALYPDLPSAELAELLQTVFNLSTPIVGFSAEDGPVLPLSFVCRFPHQLAARSYYLLTRNPTIVASAPEAPVLETAHDVPPKYTHFQADCANEATFPDASAPQVEFPTAQEEAANGYDEPSDRPDDTGLASINPQNFSKLLKFFAVMRSKKMINKEEARALEELVFDDNILLHAAFSVAESAKDADYLAEICKDIGQSVQSADGRTALGAQEHLLYICDDLHQAGQLTDNQLLYLRHLVLVRDEVVAAIYEDFTEDSNQNKLARALVLLANTHPAELHTPEPQEQPVPYDADFQVQQRVPQLDAPSHRRPQQARKELAAASTASSNDGYRPQRQNEVQENAPADVRTLLAVLHAATQLLLRAKRISTAEVELLQDLVAEEDEYVIAACDVYLQDQNMEELQDTLLRRVRFEARKRRDSEDFHQTARTTSSAASRQIDAVSQSTGEIDQVVLDQVVAEQVRRVMLALGVEDGWGEHVPMLFKRIVFVAAEAKLLSVEQAAILCHLYAAGYDLVQAAWEVYQVSNDDRDFIDTLFRVVRDLELKQSDNVANSREQVTQAAKEKLQRTRAAAVKASEEIAKAKMELLNQTLSLMVRQKFIDEGRGTLLLAKAQQGDAMIDAAIEAYANDRDVSRFVDTLQILANNADQLAGGSHSEDMVIQDGENASEEENGDDHDDDDDDDDNDDHHGNGAAAAALPTADDERAQGELRDLVNLLLDDGKISDHERAVLIRLIGACDDRILAAHDVYLEFQDVDDLVDSLLRIAKREVSDAATARQADQGIEMRMLNREEPSNEPVDAGHQGVLTPDDIQQILVILGQSNAISDADMQVLLNLAQAHDRRINAVFDSYEQNKDVYKLIQSLQMLTGNDVEIGQQAQSDADADDRSAEEALNKFLDIVEDMNLSEIETAALRLAIARDDDDVRAALEVYRLENDAEDLMDTLRRIAARVMQELGKSESADIFPRRRDQNGQEAAGDDSGEDEQEVSDEDQLDDDSEDEGEDNTENNSVLTTQGSRQHIFPILVSELVKQNFLSSKQMLVLLTLLEQNDSLIHAALDVYDGDNDMAELVDTLQRISKAVMDEIGLDATDDNDEEDYADEDDNDEGEDDTVDADDQEESHEEDGEMDDQPQGSGDEDVQDL